MNFHRTNSARRIAGLLAISFALIAPALALNPAWAEPALRANDLLRQAVAHEKLSAKDGYFAWTDRLQKPRGSVTKLMVSTPQGILSRTLAINDRPLTAEERKQDDDRIDRLLDAAKMREKNAKQREDQQHIERMLVALPDAFQCEYATSRDDRNLRLECSPNPSFSAPNYESQVLQGMKAVILIDREDSRISRIEGTLFKDVNFGWGFLGRLNRGGHIEITQARVAGKHWGIQRMQLNFDGRIIMVKPLHIEETETSWDYRSVPGMSVSQALDYLRVNSPKAAR
jgi:hypothetical protein